MTPLAAHEAVEKTKMLPYHIHGIHMREKI